MDLKNYKREDVFNETLKYFNGDELATDVWINKYCMKDSFGNYYELSPDDMHRRLAKEIARIEQKYVNPLSEEEIYQTLKKFQRIIPGGSPMSGIGNDFQVTSLGNCFVIGDTYDSYGSIFKNDQEQAQLMKRRGGIGIDLSYIRPNSTPVRNDARSSTGVVPFMERFSNTTKEVAQSGRRGALMLSISVKHPDSEAFIDAKLTQGKVTGANISVKLDDMFMDAALNNKPYIVQFPINSETPAIKKEIDAQKLWKKIIHNAWASAEPGLLYWDTLTRESISSCYGENWKETSTNPCGELPLPPYDSCRLLSVNLYGYVINPFTKNSYFDWDSFKKDVQIAQRYMDDIIDLEIEKIDRILEKIKTDPEPDEIKFVEENLWKKIKVNTINGRRTGLGITAEGDMIAAMGLIYGTEEANNFSEEIHKIFKLNAYRSSVIMAKERGAFPMFNRDLESSNPFILRILSEDPKLHHDMWTYGRRNLALLTIAPTGTLSIMTQTTSGVEPCFLPAYKRRRKINSLEKNITPDFIDAEGIQWQEYNVFHHGFEKWLVINNYDLENVKLLKQDDLQKIIELSPYYKATSNDVDWVKKVEMQGRIQKHIDHSISVTVNLPKDVTEELVSKVYETGWKCGCKGITIYRDGSRDGVLISNTEKKDIEKNQSFKDNNAPKRPKRLKGDIIRFQNNLEKWIAVVGLMDGRPYELFTGKLVNGLSKLSSSIKECEIVKNKNEDGTSRYDLEYIDENGEKQISHGISQKFDPQYWNLAKMISGNMRHGMPLVYVHQLVESLNLNDDNLNTWKNGVARVIKRYIKDGERGKGKCPECGSEHLEYKEGCLTCMGCGNSKCS